MHDACTNGHLEVIRYLLGRGASITAKTEDTHQTPLQFLKEWRLSADPLTDQELQLYNSIVRQMTAILERFGQKVVEPSMLSTCSAYQDDDKDICLTVGTSRERRRSAMSSTPSPSPRKRTQKSPKKTGGRIGEARRRICDDEDSEDEEGKEEEKESVAEGW